MDTHRFFSEPFESKLETLCIFDTQDLCLFPKSKAILLHNHGTTIHYWEIQHWYRPLSGSAGTFPSNIFPASFSRVSSILWALLHFCQLRCPRLTQDVPCPSPECAISQGSPSLPQRGMGFRNQGLELSVLSAVECLRPPRLHRGHSWYPEGIGCLSLQTTPQASSPPFIPYLYVVESYEIANIQPFLFYKKKNANLHGSSKYPFLRSENACFQSHRYIY